MTASSAKPEFCGRNVDEEKKTHQGGGLTRPSRWGSTKQEAASWLTGPASADSVLAAGSIFSKISGAGERVSGWP